MNWQIIKRKFQRLFLGGQMIPSDRGLKDDVLELLPEFTQLYRKRILNIGACGDHHELVSELIAYGGYVDIVEIYHPYVKEIRELFGHHSKVRIWENDILLHRLEDEYDGIVWWHGPEHMDKENGDILIHKLKDHLAPGGWLLLGFPWGVSPQEALDGNLTQRHVRTLGIHDVKHCWGKRWSWKTFGKKNKLGSAITAVYKR